MFVNINGTPVNKLHHLLQISVRETHNAMMLPCSEGGFPGVGAIYVSICIGYA